MKRKFTFFILLVFFGQLCLAQTATLDFSINNIKATVLNGGDLFNESVTNKNAFEVPKGSGLKTIYAAGLWIGGLDAKGSLHLAASTYRQTGTDFRPGPVSDSEYVGKNAKYDKIYYITQAEIDYHKLHYSNTNYVPSVNISNWPGNGNISKGEAQKLAPFFDKNKNKIYEPLQGDYPIITGDACAFAVFNDKRDDTTSLGIEVHQFVYAFANSGSTLDNSIFVAYKIYNRSSNDYTQMYVGHWVDYDIGNWNDDAYCSDSTRNLMIAMNGTNDDGLTGYGTRPPAMGCLFLNQKLATNITYNNDFGAHGNPTSINHYYNYLKGHYRDNSPIESFHCYDTSQGDMPGDIRLLGTTTAFDLPSKGNYCFSVAHIYARALSGGYSASVNLLKLCADTVRNHFFGTWDGDACTTYVRADGIKYANDYRTSIQIIPNPVRNQFVIKIKLNTPKSNGYEVFNTIGQKVIEGTLVGTETTIDSSNLNPGIYFIKLGDGVMKFVKE